MTDLQECIGGMEMEKFYLGFDAGTQSVKVTVYNEKMECVASTSAPTTLTYPHPGWVDMDVDEYLALTINGMAECSRQMRERPGSETDPVYYGGWYHLRNRRCG